MGVNNQINLGLGNIMVTNNDEKQLSVGLSDWSFGKGKKLKLQDDDLDTDDFLDDEEEDDFEDDEFDEFDEEIEDDLDDEPDDDLEGDL